MPGNLYDSEKLPSPSIKNQLLSIVQDCNAQFDFHDLEDLHTTLLSAAQVEHNKVRERAQSVLELDQIQHERDSLKILADAAEKRVRIETEKSVEACRIQEAENKARKSSKPATLPSTQQAPTPPTRSATSTRIQPTTTLPQAASVPTPSPLSQSKLPTTTGQTSAKASSSLDRPKSNLLRQVSPSIARSTNEPAPAPAAKYPPAKSTGARNTLGAPSTKSQNFPHGVSNIERYIQIHAEIKLVRRTIESQVDQDGKSSQLKAACSSGRREITKALGQLVVGGNNSAIVDKVVRQLRGALLDTTLSVPISLYIITSDTAATDSTNTKGPIGITGDRVPIAFIYLLGSLCKAICAQLASEASLKPQAASPIGIMTAKIFSEPHLLWRDKSLIDILISKIYVACPVLFGVRGDESTEEGRARIGWRKMNGKFISEQAHFDRMIGIAAGYAAISLRDFSRSKWRNPYPPFNYWLALSAIVSTPSEQMFPTQFVVLKGLIENSFSRFIQFYGDMAVAALHAALVEFPRRGAAGNAAVDTLKTLGVTLQMDFGLVLP